MLDGIAGHLGKELFFRHDAVSVLERDQEFLQIVGRDVFRNGDAEQLRAIARRNDDTFAEHVGAQAQQCGAHLVRLQEYFLPLVHRGGFMVDADTGDVSWVFAASRRIYENRSGKN